ncbi:MAG: hypothetical protein MH219_20230 [Marinobacter sp.]|jgi:hypothetical protein|nr:hypothetical protein [Marinobacter sp.]
MFGWLNRLWAWVSSLWTNLSDEDKEKIVNIIVSSFTALFKAFYQASKADKKDE